MLGYLKISMSDSMGGSGEDEAIAWRITTKR
jgi:hypothetical protein